MLKNSNYTVLVCCYLYYQSVFYKLSIIVSLSVRGFQIVYNCEKLSTLLWCRFQQVLRTKWLRFCNFNRKKKIHWDHFSNINKSLKWFIILFFKATEQLLSIFPLPFYLSISTSTRRKAFEEDEFLQPFLYSYFAQIKYSVYTIHDTCRLWLFKIDISTFNPVWLLYLSWKMNAT